MKLLAKLETDLSTAYAYEGCVRVASRLRRVRDLIISGRTLLNFFRGQEYLLAFMESEYPYMLVGRSSMATPTHSVAELVIEKANDETLSVTGSQLYRIGYRYASGSAWTHLVDGKSLRAIMGCAKRALWSRGAFTHDDNFWSVQARVGDDHLNLSETYLEVLYPDNTTFGITKATGMEPWVAYCEAARELTSYNVGSQQVTSSGAVLYHSNPNLIHLKYEVTRGKAIQEVHITARAEFFRAVGEMIERFWIGEFYDDFDDDWYSDVDPDDGLDEEGSLS